MSLEGTYRPITATKNPPAAESRALEIFIGRWIMEGKQYDSPFGPAARLDAIQTYEWLPGECFLIHRFDGHVGDAVAACIEIIGFEPSKQSYRYRTFYSNGRLAEWFGRERDGAWTTTAVWQMSTGSTTVRATTIFSDDGRTMTGTWEYSTDGNRWKTFWDVKATRK